MSEVDDLIAGRYRLRAMVGRGGMGVVWQATDTTLQRTVALKQLLQPNVDPQLAEQAQQRAMREGRIAARLHHPNAVAVHDVVIDNGQPVLVMEYLPSRSLADLIAEHGRLAPEMVAHVGAQVAAALSAAHAAGIVHRDVKPANILITEDGTAKLTDFGISHAAGDVALTQTGLFAGTPAFLAPEIALGHRPTAGSDVFSLGATLYAAVEGSPPFGDDAENPLALLHLIAAGQISAPQQAGPLTPVLAATLNADPARRIDAGQTSEALHATATGAPLPPFVEAAQWAEGTTVITTPAPANGPAGTLLDGQLHPASVPPGTPTPGVANGPAGTLLDGQPLPQQQPVAAPHASSGAGTNRTNYIAVGAAGAVVAAIVLLVSLLNSAEPAPVAIAAPDSPTPTTPAIQPADLESAALRYYRLLPEQPEQAWQRLAPAMRTDRSAYLARWHAVESVTVFSRPRATGHSTVHIGVTLRRPDGSRIRQFRQLGLTTNTGTPLINSMTLLHSQRIPAPQPPEVDYYDEKDKEEEEKKEEEEEKKAEEEFKEGEKPEGWEAHWKEE